MVKTPATSYTNITEVALPTRRRLWLKIPAALIAGFLGLELLFLAWYWVMPPWAEMRAGKIPASALIEDYQDKLKDDPKLPPLRWKPIVKAVPKNISKIFLLAEDSRFYEHDGFDYEAIRKAFEYNWKKGKVVRGASTISQQTAKNLFLSLSRNPLRKWHEVLLTYMLEAKLSKPQILHAYLNVAEFGMGIYGIEAAAQAYFHRPAHRLTQQQAGQLAASLPSPKKHNPKTLTRAFQQRNKRVSYAIRMVDQYNGLRGKKPMGATSALPTDAELAAKLREVMADSATEKTENDESETAPALDSPAIDPAAEALDPSAAISGEEIDARAKAKEEEEKAKTGAVTPEEPLTTQPVDLPILPPDPAPSPEGTSPP